MNQKKYNVLLATLSMASVLSSCAGPESYQQKMARYEPKAISKNQVPEIQSSEFKFKMSENGQASRVSRAPASAPENPNRADVPYEMNATNKKLYFLTLYSEYESLKNYSPEFSGPSVSICPNFHTSLLKHNDKAAVLIKTAPAPKKFSYDSTKYSDNMYVTSRPELLLPLSKDELTPKVIDVIKSAKTPMSEVAVNDLVHKAIDIHLAKTYSEIRELCEYGVSDNYYIYENLITYIKNNKFEAAPKNMNTLLKTTLFSNMALMSSLNKQTKTTGRSIASANSPETKNPYANEVMTRLNVTWANQFFDYIKESH